MDKLLAWHFCAADRKLGYGDGREIKEGESLRVEGTPVLCKFGLHASVRILDALKYASGPILCRVELSDGIVLGYDKAVARERKTLWMFDATNALRDFAATVAENALLAERKAGREPDQRSWAAVQFVRDLLAGKIAPENQSVAWSVARSAAEAAARSVAWSEARSAAEAVARSAAEAAAEAVARSAAEAVAWSEARSAAEAVARSAAEAAARSEARSAAEAVARSAAEAAARSVARSAAEAAARSEARSAAEAAARSVAWSVAEVAARSAAEAAARSAAEAAARSAAEAAQNDLLMQIVERWRNHGS